jgi:hypothetical protein
MKKKYLLLLAAIAVISVSVFVVAVVLPTRPGITKANFDRVQIGMTQAEVVEIFGERPSDIRPTYRWVESREVSGTWCSADYRSGVLVLFRYGHVVDARWYDSPETLWDKLRRWVGLK